MASYTYAPTASSPSYVSYSVKAPTHKPRPTLSTSLKIDARHSSISSAGSVSPGPSPVSRELPMPNVTRIYTLSQAHATLLHCRNKLSRLTREASESAAKGGPTTFDVADYHRWLDRWEQAFTEFLSSGMPSMTTDGLTQCRVLKANHLACTILASDASSRSPNHDVFEAEFQAIVELAGAVLRTRHEAASPKSTSSSLKDYDYSSTTLDVRDPLYVVATRCPFRKIRSRASDLLSAYYR